MKVDMQNAILFVVAFLAIFMLAKNKGKIVNILFAIIDSNFYKILKPLLLALPSGIISCYKIDSIRNIIPTDFIGWLDDHLWYIAAGLFVFPVIASVEEIIRKQAPIYSENLPLDGYALLLKALDYPVDAKMNRFLSELHSLSKTCSDEQIFKKITQPDLQLAEIARAIHIFFDGLARLLGVTGIEFTTVFFKMENGIPVDSLSYFPVSNRPEEGLLNDPSSLAANAAKGIGRMIIIQDIEKERKNQDH